MTEAAQRQKATPAEECVTDRLPWPQTEAPLSGGQKVWRVIGHLPRHLLRVPILIYRYTLSSFMGRQCRYLPTCSQYADEAIARHGAWRGLFMATARICRCHPWGGHGYDPVPECVPEGGRWYRPWAYGIWRMKKEPEDQTEPGEKDA